MTGRIVEYLGTNKQQRRINPTGLFPYVFRPQAVINGVPADVRKVCIVEDDKALSFFKARPSLFTIADDLESAVRFKEFLDGLSSPHNVHALVGHLETLGFHRDQKVKLPEIVAIEVAEEDELEPEPEPTPEEVQEDAKAAFVKQILGMAVRDMDDILVGVDDSDHLAAALDAERRLSAQKKIKDRLGALSADAG